MSKKKSFYPLSIHSLNLNFSHQSFNIENRLFLNIPVSINESADLLNLHIHVLEICFEKNSSYSKYKSPVMIINDKLFIIKKDNFKEDYIKNLNNEFGGSKSLFNNEYINEYAFFENKNILLNNYEIFFNNYLNNSTYVDNFDKYITQCFKKSINCTDYLTNEQQEYLTKYKQKATKELIEFTYQVKNISLDLLKNFNNLLVYNQEQKIQMHGDFFKKSKIEDKNLFNLFEELSTEWQYCVLSNHLNEHKYQHIAKKSLKL